MKSEERSFRLAPETESLRRLPRTRSRLTQPRLQRLMLAIRCHFIRSNVFWRISRSEATRSSRFQPLGNFGLQVLCTYTRTWIAPKICEALVQDRFLSRREARIFHFDR